MQQGLVVRIVTDGRSTRPPGMVVQQAPAAGTTAASGTMVTVYVSGHAGSGAPSPVPSPTATACAYPEPSATPYPVPSATATAVPVPSATAYPVPSTPATTAVPIPSATAPAEAMPNVIGETQAQAERTLQQIGVSALIVRKAASSGHHAAGTVWGQYPPAGATVARGMKVTLYVQP